MDSLKINNSLAFQGAREILNRDIVGNSKKLSRPMQEVLSQSELRAATLELMQDLNGMVIPKASRIEKIEMDKMFSEQATKLYNSTVEELNSKIIK